MATIKDVARHAGVSAGTVSNVLNRPGYVALETRERVLTSIADLGFTPTQEARKFRSGRGRTLGLALADLANPFFIDVALGA
ncbi:MAG: LacI family DNA-binding transcriptional regulator, partial [Herbiconiux sp.]|nr:LacI family DNA-binding transcriptional regulator [Herbiconiux sp.]